MARPRRGYGTRRGWGLSAWRGADGGARDVVARMCGAGGAWGGCAAWAEAFTGMGLRGRASAGEENADAAAAGQLGAVGG